jgi:hypothetical protein
VNSRTLSVLELRAGVIACGTRLFACPASLSVFPVVAADVRAPGLLPESGSLAKAARSVTYLKHQESD